MKDLPEPEILVPPDMEDSESTEATRSPVSLSTFPIKRLIGMVLMSILFISISGMGISKYMKTGNLNEVIPYWVFSVLLLAPTACSYYFFFSFFQPRLRNPYEWDNSF